MLKQLSMMAFQNAWKRNVRRHPLKWLEIELTRRCPLACRHCGSSCEIRSPYETELSSDEILDVCRKIAARHNPRFVKVAITGGEPMLRTDLFTLIARITEMGFRVGMVTSGYLLRKEHLILFEAARLRSFAVSLDGLEQTHNWLRGKPDAFQKAIAAIRLILNYGPFYCEALSTINRRNFPELPLLEKLILDTGLRRWRIAKTFPIGRAAANPELLLTGHETRQLLDFIVARRRRPAGRPPLHVEYCEEGYFGKEYERETHDYHTQCQAGVNQLTVLADGSITGCAAASRRFVQGNIRTHDILDVWNNRFAPFRDRSWMRRGRCGNCGSWNDCRGDGFHLWDPDSENPAVCNLSLLKS